MRNVYRLFSIQALIVTLRLLCPLKHLLHLSISSILLGKVSATTQKCFCLQHNPLNPGHESRTRFRNFRNSLTTWIQAVTKHWFPMMKFFWGFWNVRDLRNVRIYKKQVTERSKSTRKLVARSIRRNFFNKFVWKCELLKIVTS